MAAPMMFHEILRFCVIFCSFVKLYVLSVWALIEQLLQPHRSFDLRDIPRGDGRVAMVTGAETGIGYQVARELLRLGYHVVMGSRHTGTTAVAVHSLKKQAPNAKVTHIPLDLSSLASVRLFVRTFRQQKLPLHLLINNAGVMLLPQQTTEEGLDHVTCVNYLAPLLLSLLLLDVIRASCDVTTPARDVINETSSDVATPAGNDTTSADDVTTPSDDVTTPSNDDTTLSDDVKASANQRCARIVNVSSVVHEMAAFTDCDQLQGRPHYSSHSVYANSKLAVLMATYELNRRLSLADSCHVTDSSLAGRNHVTDWSLAERSHVTVIAVHPGIVNSGLFRNVHWSWRWIQRIVAPILLKTARQGADTVLCAALSPALEARGGLYLTNCQVARSSRASYESGTQARLWRESLRLVGLSDGVH